MLTRSALLFAFAAVPAILGFPSIFADMRQLAETLGMPPAEWHLWNYLMVGGGLFVMALGAYGMALGAHRRWAQGRTPQGKAHSVDAGAASHHWHVPQPTATTTRASSWIRIGNWIIRRTRLRKSPVWGVAEIERCHQELVKYIRSQPPDPIGFEHVALWGEFQPHIVDVCRILDEQKIPYPEIDVSIIFVDMGKWGTFLARLLAVKDDVRKARLVYSQMQFPAACGESAKLKAEGIRE